MTRSARRKRKARLTNPVRAAWHSALAGVLLSAFASGAFATSADVELGRQIYLEGRAGSVPIVATRAAGVATSGAGAACVNCHRRSGMGGSEGRTHVPPIDASALRVLASPGAMPRQGVDPAQAALARALNDGVAQDGRALNYLMPRYRLAAPQLDALAAYLRTLSAAPPAGISNGVVHLASVIAGGVDARQRRIMKTALQACVAEHNAGPGHERRRKLLSAQMQRAEPQRWALHVWELSGPASGWDAQLRDHAKRQPVFAMLGGLVDAAHGGDWMPVQQFCEREALPCIYPHLEAPPVAAANHHSIYAGAGVHLEAALMAARLRETAPRRVVQWLRFGDFAAQAGADALHESLAGSDIEVVQRQIERDSPVTSVAQVLWLRGADLTRVAPPSASTELYLSATLLGHDFDAVPASLRSAAVIAHPHALPEERATRLRVLGAWLAKQGLPLEDESLQADAYMACSALQHAMDEVVQRPGAEFLIERLEVITERRGFAGLYPRLSLGTGQRVASKTGYLVRFPDADLTRVEPLGDAKAP